MARGSQVWMNGKILPAEEIRLSLFTHALHYGVGAFEGIRAYKQKNGGGAIFRLNEHMERLIESVKILGFSIPYGVEELSKAAVEVCKANHFEECYIRPIAFVGDGPLGVDPGPNPPIEVAILNWEWGKYLGDDSVNKGAKMKISSFIRPHANSSMTKGKLTGQYITGVLAKREAVSDGYDEGLLLDPEGFLSEGTGENLFIIKDGIVKTTALTSILNGITRRTIIQYLRNRGIEIQEARFTRDELICADEVFLTGTAAEITPVSEIDRRKIGKGEYEGKPGPMTLRIKNDYANMVRGDLPEYGKNWLTPIR